MCKTLLSGVSTLSLSRYLSVSSCLMAEATFLLAAVIQEGHAKVAPSVAQTGAHLNTGKSSLQQRTSPEVASKNPA